MPDFYNAVVEGQSAFPTGVLLRLFSKIERQAGRRPKQRWSARPLDIDLLDHGGRIINWPRRTRPGGPIVLPHPLLHQRGFVVVPLAEIAPHWRHPVLGTTAASILAANPQLRRGILPA
jgi:2-amino-4-hydroxy-6-hydroxymethyldihydropteridine diphosphokinase